MPSALHMWFHFIPATSLLLPCKTLRYCLCFGERKLELRKAQRLANRNKVNKIAELGVRARPIILHLKYLSSKPRTDAENSVSKEVQFGCIPKVLKWEVDKGRETKSFNHRHEKIKNYRWQWLAQEILRLKKPKGLPMDRLREVPALMTRWLVSIWYHMILFLKTV